MFLILCIKIVMSRSCFFVLVLGSRGCCFVRLLIFLGLFNRCFIFLSVTDLFFALSLFMICLCQGMLGQFVGFFAFCSDCSTVVLFSFFLLLPYLVLGLFDSIFCLFHFLLQFLHLFWRIVLFPCLRFH